MAEIWEDHEDDTPLVQQLRKQIKTLTTSKTEAEDRAAAAEGKLKAIDLKATLADRVSNPDRAAKFLAADGVDTADADAVTKWLEENSDLFPPKQTAEATPEQEQQQPGPGQEVVDGYRQYASTSMLQRPADMNKLTELDRKLPANATPEQVLAELRNSGI